MDTLSYRAWDDAQLVRRSKELLDIMRHADDGVITLPAFTISMQRPHSAMAQEYKLSLQACQLLVVRGLARRVNGTFDWPTFKAAQPPRVGAGVEMSKLDEYQRLLEPHCGPAFSFREICAPPSTRLALPPVEMQRNIIPTLELANELRLRMAYRCDREGWAFRGLRVNAAYRPHGGAPSSQHKKNRALDLDLMFRDWDPATVKHSTEIRRAYYEVGVALWYENGKSGGFGLYCSRGKDLGVRIHIDCRSGSATWQMQGVATAIHPPCTYRIAERLGLT